MNNTRARSSDDPGSELHQHQGIPQAGRMTGHTMGDDSNIMISDFGREPKINP
jgi:hypothetical protein